MGITKKCKWLYILKEDYEWDASEHLGKTIKFNCRWLRVNEGMITVKKGYAWDGCSPKFVIADLWIIGTPDGRKRYGKPVTYRASLVHDALTQFKDELPITHQQATAVFSALLKEAEFFWHRVYVLMIRVFGTRKFLGNKLEK